MTRRKKKKTGSKGWWAILAALLISGVFGLNKQNGENRLPQEWSTIINKQTNSEDKLTENVSESSEKSMALPASLKNRNEHIIHYKGYIVSYNSEWKIPNWVAWELTSDETDAKIPREDSFCEDPDFSGAQASLEDYRGSGYSRGHMAPAADMRWNEDAMKECFYLTNMCPQNASFNSGNWGQLERQCREWAQKEGTIWIVCGPIVGKSPKHIGEGMVVVPDGFYKVIMAPHAKSPKAIGFVYPHKNKKGARLREFAMSVDEVEKRTGIDFFSSLPDDIEKKVEAQRPETGRWRFYDEQSKRNRLKK